MTAPTEATALTAAPVKGVVLLLGVTPPVPVPDGAETIGAAPVAVVVGCKTTVSAMSSSESPRFFS